MADGEAGLLTVTYETLTAGKNGAPSPVLVDAVAEIACDIAHEHCGEDGCTAGGPQWWRDATEVVLAAVAEHMRLTREEDSDA